MCTFLSGNVTGWGSEEVNTPRNATAATRGRSVPLFHPRLWALTVLLIAMSSPKIPIASQRGWGDKCSLPRWNNLSLHVIHPRHTLAAFIIVN